MLSNAYFLAKFRFDTAENEPAKNLQKFANFPNFANPNHRPAPAEETARFAFGFYTGGLLPQQWSYGDAGQTLEGDLRSEEAKTFSM